MIVMIVDSEVLGEKGIFEEEVGLEVEEGRGIVLQSPGGGSMPPWVLLCTPGVGGPGDLPLSGEWMTGPCVSGVIIVKR